HRRPACPAVAAPKNAASSGGIQCPCDVRMRRQTPPGHGSGVHHTPTCSPIDCPEYTAGRGYGAVADDHGVKYVGVMRINREAWHPPSGQAGGDRFPIRSSVGAFQQCTDIARIIANPCVYIARVFWIEDEPAPVAVRTRCTRPILSCVRGLI